MASIAAVINIDERSNTMTLPDSDNPSSTAQFNFVYDLTYDGDSQTVLFHDIVNEVYDSMPFFLFQAFTQAHWDADKALGIINAILNYRDVRIIPSERRAVMFPRSIPSFVTIAVQALNELPNVGLDEYEDVVNYCRERWGVSV